MLHFEEKKIFYWIPLLSRSCCTSRSRKKENSGAMQIWPRWPQTLSLSQSAGWRLLWWCWRRSGNGWPTTHSLQKRHRYVQGVSVIQPGAGEWSLWGRNYTVCTRGKKTASFLCKHPVSVILQYVCNVSPTHGIKKNKSAGKEGGGRTSEEMALFDIRRFYLEFELYFLFNLPRRMFMTAWFAGEIRGGGGGGGVCIRDARLQL